MKTTKKIGYSTVLSIVDKYPDFPTALTAFLIQQGYLNKNGRP